MKREDEDQLAVNSIQMEINAGNDTTTPETVLRKRPAEQEVEVSTGAPVAEDSGCKRQRLEEEGYDGSNNNSNATLIQGVAQWTVIKYTPS